MFYKTAFLENLTKFTGKPQCRSLLVLVKLQARGLQLCEKRDSDRGVFL